MPTWLSPDVRGEEAFGKIEAIREAARAGGITPAQCAIAWAIAQEGVTAAVVGVTREGQLREAARAGEVQLPPATLEKLKTLR